MSTPKYFNVRIYGILMDEKKRVLVADEFIRGEFFTKFPGGGLELGEGTRDCLKREFKEETNMDVTIGAHIYTTDFFQVSAFNKNDQIISIYYFVQAADTSGLATSEKVFDFTEEQIADKTAQYESFRWVEWDNLNADDITLPIDKIVVKMIKGES
ncbi:MAG: NUDIX hydrolase [Filimonas sp.]|nr:NUDIX hydrolase [Filimonas sp.]